MDPSNELPDLKSADLKPDWASLLPPQVFASVILWLRAALPPPLVDEPDEWLARDRVAMTAVVSLVPATAAEGRLAAQFVAADAYAMDCLRLAQEARLEPDTARKCAGQAMAMMRESKSAMRVLLRVQTARHKVAANEVAAKQADWVEHAAVNLMAAAPARVPMVVQASPGAAGNASELARMSDDEIKNQIACNETTAGFDRSAGAWMAVDPLFPACSHQGRR